MFNKHQLLWFRRYENLIHHLYDKKLIISILFFFSKLLFQNHIYYLQLIFIFTIIMFFTQQQLKKQITSKSNRILVWHINKLYKQQKEWANMLWGCFNNYLDLHSQFQILHPVFQWESLIILELHYHLIGSYYRLFSQQQGKLLRNCNMIMYWQWNLDACSCPMHFFFGSSIQLLLFIKLYIFL